MVTTNVLTGMMNLSMNTLSKQEIIIIAAILMVVPMVRGVTQLTQIQNGIYAQFVNAKPVLMNLPMLSWTVDNGHFLGKILASGPFHIVWSRVRQILKVSNILKSQKALQRKESSVVGTQNLAKLHIKLESDILKKYLSLVDLRTINVVVL